MDGKKIDRKEGHRILGLLAERDTKALKMLPVVPGRKELGSFEFGLGHDEHDVFQ